jgi:hypothetical protein
LFQLLQTVFVSFQLICRLPILTVVNSGSPFVC